MLSDATSRAERLRPGLDGAWRAQAERAQAAVMPPGRVAVSAPAPFGVGGLGRHLQEIVAALQRAGSQAACVCEPAGREAPPGPCQNVHPGVGVRAAVAPRAWAFSTASTAWAVAGL